jgi:hypothetical protein
MFSNEVAHDWTVNPDIPGIGGIKAGIQTLTSKSSYHVYGTTQQNKPDDTALCLAMRYKAMNSYICGTFDGFGIWTWSNFCAFIEEFSTLTKLTGFGVYDAQFIMPHWSNAPSYKFENTAIELHVYLGAWPNLAVTDPKTKLPPEGDANTMSVPFWKDICNFCGNQPGIVGLYMDVDDSGRKSKYNTTSFLTPENLAMFANTAQVTIPHLKYLGAVITANPGDGYRTPGVDVKDQEQPGGNTYIVGDWTKPLVPHSKDVEQSFCATVQYSPACPNVASDPNNKNPLTDVAGCPNTIQNSMYLMSRANEIIKSKPGKQLIFSRFIQDGENNHTAACQYCVWWNSAIYYMGPGTISNLDPNDICLGQAFNGSTNTGGEFLMAKDQEYCQTKYPVKLSNFIAFPELYWYSDMMKSGVIGFADVPVSNPTRKLLVALIAKTLNSSDEDAISLLSNGTGCEGCDHNHIGAGRAARTLGTTDTWSLGKLIKESGGSGWPKGVAVVADHPCSAKFDLKSCNTDPKIKCDFPCLEDNAMKGGQGKNNNPDPIVCDLPVKGVPNPQCQKYFESAVKGCGWDPEKIAAVNGDCESKGPNRPNTCRYTPPKQP